LVNVSKEVYILRKEEGNLKREEGVLIVVVKGIARSRGIKTWDERG